MHQPTVYRENDYTLNSAWIANEGWDFPEAAYVASLNHVELINLPISQLRLATSAARAATALGPLDLRPGKNSRASVSGGKIPAL